MATLTLKKLSKSFGKVKAVNAFSVSLDSGELMALVGPSGCGKTTMLRLIAGFETPDAGSITIQNTAVNDLPPEQRGVGVVFQHYALFPHKTVEANIAFGLKIAKAKNVPAKVDEWLERMELIGLAKRKPDQLSAGQRQRVALARALAPSPRVILLDEPLSALDVQLRERLRLDIRRTLKESNTTAIYITHDQEEALAIADRVAVMNAGILEQVDVPKVVYQRPASRFVANFIGQGNVIEAVLAEQEARHTTFHCGQSIFEGPPMPSVQLGKKVCLLIRPEHFRLEDNTELTLRCRVLQTEFLGHAVRAHLLWEEQTLVALLPASAELASDVISVSFSAQAVWPLPDSA